MWGGAFFSLLKTLSLGWMGPRRHSQRNSGLLALSLFTFPTPEAQGGRHLPTVAPRFSCEVASICVPARRGLHGRRGAGGWEEEDRTFLLCLSSLSGHGCVSSGMPLLPAGSLGSGKGTCSLCACSLGMAGTTSRCASLLESSAPSLGSQLLCHLHTKSPALNCLCRK